MDISERTRAVYDRIQEFEPQHVSIIMGYLLLKEHVNQEMTRLASCPDAMLRSLINKAKSELGLIRNPILQFPPPS